MGSATQLIDHMLERTGHIGIALIIATLALVVVAIAAATIITADLLAPSQAPVIVAPWRW